MKRLLIILLAVVVLAGLVAPAEAGHGGHGRGRWEGLAIGLGAVSLYNLFSYGMFAPVVPPYTYGPPAAVYAPPVVYQQPAVVYQAPTVVCPPPAYYGCPPPVPVQDYGPERVWAPGYWQEQHRWVPGHWDWQ